jgi:hypothetical protein
MNTIVNKALVAAAVVLLAGAWTVPAIASTSCTMTSNGTTATCSGTNDSGGACQAYIGTDENGNPDMVCLIVAHGKNAAEVLPSTLHVKWNNTEVGQGHDKAQAVKAIDKKRK